ncbi:MAG: C-GCAxxG-C-C family protein [Oscillibacter sp.]|nr:C-GCAxxG-C-C family protein [Oscillibacter sp.]
MTQATAYFYRGGLNCAESTLRCLVEDGVIQAPPEAVRMMTGFGGGMQRGATCGAVIAAVAAIGWAFGRTDPSEDRSVSARAVRTFLQRFEASFGTLNCAELRSVYAREHALKSEGMYRSCTVFVERARTLAEEVIREERARAGDA